MEEGEKGGKGGGRGGGKREQFLTNTQNTINQSSESGAINHFYKNSGTQIEKKI